jgi:hypothetical protein
VAAQLNFEGLPFRVYPHIDADLAANYRGSIENLHNRALRICDSRSSDCRHTHGDCDSLDVRAFHGKKTWSVLSSVEQLKKPRGFFGDASPC